MSLSIEEINNIELTVKQYNSLVKQYKELYAYTKELEAKLHEYESGNTRETGVKV